MGKFHRDHAVLSQKDFEAFNKIVQGGNMSKDIVAQHEVGFSPFRDQFVVQCLP